MKALTGQVFAAVYTVFECSGKYGNAVDATRPRGRHARWQMHDCRHDKIEKFEFRFYPKIGAAKSYVTQKRKQGQTEEQAFVLVGEIADMIRLDADAQARYEHEESRSMAHAEAANEALKDASAPARKPRRKKAA